MLRPKRPRRVKLGEDAVISAAHNEDGHMTPRIVTMDIECAPNLAHVWGLWNQNVSLAQLRQSAETMCVVWKWHDNKRTRFVRTMGDAKLEGLQAVWQVLDECDAMITYNGDRYDIPHLNREFLEAGLAPPSPFKSIDLFKTVRSRFRFPSNKLDYVTQRLELGSKMKHEGHQLWVDCMAGDSSAWKRMEKYNRQDVVITEKLFDELRPWIKNLPNPRLYDLTASDVHTCPECGSERVQRRGYAHTTVSVYQRFQCSECGRWSRGGRKALGVDLRAI